MSHCGECGQPVHPHQMTCGSCGVSLRMNPPAREPSSDPHDGEPSGPGGSRTEGQGGRPSLSTEGPAFEKPDESEVFTLDDPLDTTPQAAPGPAAQPTPLEDEIAGPSVASLPGDSERLLRRRRRRPRPNRPAPAGSSAFLSRAWALVVDAMVLALASMTLPPLARLGIRIAEAVSGSTELYDDVLTDQLTTIGQIALVAGYFVVLHADEQTIGKKLMGLHVVRPDGEPLDPLQSLARLCGYAFSLMPLGFGFLLAAFKPYRALHDYLVGSIVVRTRDIPQPEGEDPDP